MTVKNLDFLKKESRVAYVTMYPLNSGLKVIQALVFRGESLEGIVLDACSDPVDAEKILSTLKSTKFYDELRVVLIKVDQQTSKTDIIYDTVGGPLVLIVKRGGEIVPMVEEQEVSTRIKRMLFAKTKLYETYSEASRKIVCGVLRNSGV